MENTNQTSVIAANPVDDIKIIKAIKNKIKNRYEWAWYCIGIQMILSQGISFGLMIVAMIIAAVNGSYSVADLTSSIMIYAIPIAAVSYLVANPVSALISLKVTKTAKFRDYLRKPDMSIGLIILAIFATIGLSNVDSFIMNLFSFIFSSSSEQLNESISSGLFSDNMFMTVISVLYICILGPFTEELLCRGAIMSLGGHVSPHFGIFISAFIFGVFHLNISQFFNAFILGLLLGFVTYKAGSIIPAVFMHIANNSLAVISMVANSVMTEERAELFNTILSISLTVIGIIALIVFIVINLKSEKQKGKGTIICNKPVSADEMEKVTDSEIKKTFGYCFTRWSFFFVFGFFVVSCIMVFYM